MFTIFSLRNKETGEVVQIDIHNNNVVYEFDAGTVIVSFAHSPTINDIMQGALEANERLAV